MTILQELYNLGIKGELFKRTDSKGKKEKSISGHIVLDDNGNFLRFEPLKEDKIKRCYCPTLGNTNGATNADFLVDNADNILNINSKKHPNYVENIKDCAETCEEMLPYALFLEEYDSNEGFRNSVLAQVSFEDLSKVYISVKINGVCLEDEPWWKDWFLPKISLKTPIS